MISTNPLAPPAMRLVAGAAVLMTLVGCSKTSPAAEGPQVPPSLRPTLESLSAAAGDLQRADQEDPASVRKAFGKVSRDTIALVGADSTLSKGRYVYECAMTEGYGKWIQTTDKIANPYMGSRMLECGAEVAWDANP